MAFISLAKKAELKDGVVKQHRQKGLDLLLIHNEGCVYIIDNRCPHDGAALTKGSIVNSAIRCPKHRICFDLESGLAQGGDAVANLSPLNHYKPVWQGEQVGILLPD